MNQMLKGFGLKFVFVIWEDFKRSYELFKQDCPYELDLNVLFQMPFGIYSNFKLASYSLNSIHEEYSQTNHNIMI